MKQIIVVFDFDGTITNKDTLWLFVKHTHSLLQITGNLCLILPYLLLYKARLMNNGKAKQKLFSVFYKDWSIEKFNSFCQSFQPIIDNCIRTDVYQTLRKHLGNGNKVVIVSASIENWIMPWAMKEGLDTVIATRIEVSPQGKLTGQFASPNCYGKEKNRRILHTFPERGSYTLIAYGDSKGDLEMLNMADESYYLKHNKLFVR